MNIPFADGLLHAYVARGARTRAVAPMEAWRAADTKRVLLVLTTGLGDAVLSTPVFPAVRRALPHTDIRLLCRAAWAPLFTEDADVNRVITYPGKYRRFFALVRELREFAPDLTLVLHGNDPDVIPLAYLAGSRFIVRIPTAGTRYRFLLSNHDRDADRATVPGMHYIENRLRILETLGVPPAGATPRVYLDTAADARVTASLTRLFHDKPYWVLHAFAADRYKTWSLENVKALISAARARHPGHMIVLTGSAADRAPLLEVGRGVEDVHVVAGALSIAETAACLSHSRCVIGPDTGVLHLAAAVGTRVVGLYGATSAALVGPRSAKSTPIVIQKPVGDSIGRHAAHASGMERITVDEVLSALDEALAA